MSNLALSGGEPVRRRPFPAWPVFDACEEKLLLEVLRSGEWWRYTLGEALEPTAGESSQKSKGFQEVLRSPHLLLPSLDRKMPGSSSEPDENRDDF